MEHLERVDPDLDVEQDEAQECDGRAADDEQGRVGEEEVELLIIAE